MIPTVFLIDDDASVLRGLARLLRSAGHTVECFASASEFLGYLGTANAGADKLKADVPGCVLTDLRMPGMNGLDLQRESTIRGFHLPFIFFSGDTDVPSTVRAMKNGALDFLTKPVEERIVLEAVRVALARNSEQREVRELFETLTPREREVCSGVARGLLNKQIAWELGTAEKTVKVHRARVMEKLGATTVADLVRLVDRLKSF